MIPSKTPKLVSQYFGKYIWEIPNEKQQVFLTFDDGPIPEVTPWVLDVLNEFKIKATFFCVGENIEKHPDTFKRLIAEGHQIGNHTYNHLNGWKVSTETYLENIKKAENVLLNHGKETQLFRPPYGKLKPGQSKAVRDLGYNIIMWSVLTKDYSLKLQAQKIYDNIMQTTSGSIIVCHDNIKAFKSLKEVLPNALKDLKERGYQFKTL